MHLDLRSFVQYEQCLKVTYCSILHSNYKHREATQWVEGILLAALTFNVVVLNVHNVFFKCAHEIGDMHRRPAPTSAQSHIPLQDIKALGTLTGPFTSLTSNTWVNIFSGESDVTASHVSI